MSNTALLLIYIRLFVTFLSDTQRCLSSTQLPQENCCDGGCQENKKQQIFAVTGNITQADRNFDYCNAFVDPVTYIEIKGGNATQRLQAQFPRYTCVAESYPECSDVSLSIGSSVYCGREAKDFIFEIENANPMICSNSNLTCQTLVQLIITSNGSKSNLTLQQDTWDENFGKVFPNFESLELHYQTCMNEILKFQIPISSSNPLNVRCGHLQEPESLLENECLLPSTKENSAITTESQNQEITEEQTPKAPEHEEIRKEKKEKWFNNSTIIYAIAGAGVGLLLLITVCICCCICCRKKKETQSSKTDDENPIINQIVADNGEAGLRISRLESFTDGLSLENKTDENIRRTEAKQSEKKKSKKGSSKRYDNTRQEESKNTEEEMTAENKANEIAQDTRVSKLENPYEEMPMRDYPNEVFNSEVFQASDKTPLEIMEKGQSKNKDGPSTDTSSEEKSIAEINAEDLNTVNGATTEVKTERAILKPEELEALYSKPGKPKPEMVTNDVYESSGTVTGQANCGPSREETTSNQIKFGHSNPEKSKTNDNRSNEDQFSKRTELEDSNTNEALTETGQKLLPAVAQPEDDAGEYCSIKDTT